MNPRKRFLMLNYLKARKPWLYYAVVRHAPTTSTRGESRFMRLRKQRAEKRVVWMIDQLEGSVRAFARMFGTKEKGT